MQCMESTKYFQGLLVVAKEGNNPWWPGEVVRCAKYRKCVTEVDSNVMVYINFLDIDFKAWINTNSILRVSNRDKMNTILETKHCLEGDNMKYVNVVPQTMQESYNKAWDKYNRLMKQFESEYEVDDVDMKDGSVTEVLGTLKDCTSLCEVCVNKSVDFVSSLGKKGILSLSVIDRDRLFASIVIAAGEAVFQCDNQCVWKYHSRCVTSNADLVCGCNKSVWQCSVCDQPVSVTQLFLCNNYECMRAYHKICLATYLDLQPDLKQCPLHQCINCRLDDLTTSSDDHSTSLVYCVKCKLAFHSHQKCLPSAYVTIADGYIICGRHLLDQHHLSVIESAFCFTCNQPITDDQSVCCSYCAVTYHNCVGRCVPGWIDMVDDKHFICNGCKFPGARRWQYPVLILPLPDTGDTGLWKIAVPVNASSDCENIVVQDIHTTDQYSVSLARLVSINLQSLDHLASLSLTRYTDMQMAIHKLAMLVDEVALSLGLTKNYRRNAFVLHYSSMYPITANVCTPMANGDNESCSIESVKCVCTNYCSTSACSNVAANIECTERNCSLVSKCRNRRMQRRLYPRQKLVLNGDEGPQVVLDEAVVKNVLVMEIVGEVHTSSYCDTVLAREHRLCLFSLANDQVLDNSRYCGLSRFIGHSSDCPNVVVKTWTVSGAPRLGLFSCRRISANEVLTVDLSTVLVDAASLTSASSSLRGALVPWSDYRTNAPSAPVTLLALSSSTTDSDSHVTVCPVIDLCDDDDGAMVTDANGAISDGGGGGGDAAYNDDTRMMCQRPLCPVCLKELRSDYSTQRAMIHCVNCYTVHHLQCATHSLTVTRIHCRMEKDPRLMRYICELCRRLDQ